MSAYQRFSNHPLLVVAILGSYRNLRSKLGVSGVLFIVLMALLSSAALLPRANVITVDALTERTAYVVTEAALSEIDITGGSIALDPLDSSQANTLAETDMAFLEPLVGTRVEIVKSSSSKVYISLFHNSGPNLNHGDDRNNAIPVGRVNFGDQQINLHSGAIITLDPQAPSRWSPWPRVIPFRGSLDQLGDDVSPGVHRILLSGSVKIAEENLFDNTRYLAHESTLDKADRLRIESAKSSQPSVTDGFVRISPDHALEVVIHSNDSKAFVERFGSAGYAIKPSIWNRLSNDPTLSWVTALLGALLLSLELVTALSALTQRRSEKP